MLSGNHVLTVIHNPVHYVLAKLLVSCPNTQRAAKFNAVGRPRRASNPSAKRPLRALAISTLAYCICVVATEPVTVIARVASPVHAATTELT